MSYWQQLDAGIVSDYYKTLRNIENGTTYVVVLYVVIKEGF